MKRIHAELCNFLHKPHGDVYDNAVLSVEQLSGLSRVTIAYALLACFAIYLMLGLALAQILCSLIGFVYPAYASVKAIRSADHKNDKQWLTYWTVFAFFSVADNFAEAILNYMPFYHGAKALFFVYLLLPQTQGAQHFYNNFIDPMITAYDYWAIEHVPALHIASDDKEEQHTKF